VLAGASVTVELQDTHVSRTEVADKNGFVGFENIPVGDYVLRARKDGFSDLVESGITLTAGQKSNLKLALQVTSANNQAGGEAPAISTETSAPGETVSKSDVMNLPKDSSNSVDFSLSVANSSDQQGSVMGSSISEQQSTEQASAINASGHRLNSTSYLVDNVENDGLLSGSVRQTIPSETISQTQVLTGLNSAEYGKASATITNITTKSGSDQWKGVLYLNARNGSLNAKPYCFNNPAGCADTGIYNNYGAAIGGPLRKDKTYFFASAEYTGQNSSRPTIFNWANDGSYFTQVNAALQGTTHPFLGASVTSLDSSGFIPMSTAQTLVSVRLDHTINKSNTLMLLLLFAQSNHANTTNDCNTRQYSDVSNCGSDQAHSASFVGAYTHVFSPTLLNEFHFQYSPDYVNQNPTSTGPTAYILDTTEFGANYDLPTEYDESHYGWTDALTKTAGRHLLKFGAETLWLRMYNYAPIQQQGRWEFSNSGDFVNGVPYRLVQEFGNFKLQEDETDISFYAQDVWRFKPRITLSYGLRYDVNLQPQGYNQNLSDPIQAPLAKGIPNHYLNFAPRLGIAWALNGSGKTVLRVGYGMFYDRILTIVSRNLLLTRQELFLDSATNMFSGKLVPSCETTDTYSAGPYAATYAYPSVMPASVTGDKSCSTASIPAPYIYALNNSLPTPFSLQGTVNLDQQLSQNWVLTLNFMNISGQRRLKATDSNLPPPVILTANNATGGTPYWQQLGRPYYSYARLNPNYFDIMTYGSWGHATYNSLMGSITHRTSNNLTLRASWTWAHEIDDASDFTSGQEPDNPYNPHAEKSVGLQDQRHRFMLTGVYHFPYRVRRTRHNSPLRWTFGNWEAFTSSIVSSGSPYNITIGHDANGDTGPTGKRPYINNLNGLQGGGEVGRDAFRGARKATVNLRLQKEVPFSSRQYRLTLTAEAFNLLNYTNFGTPYTYWGETPTPTGYTSGPPLAWGRPMDLSSTCVECSTTFGAWTSAGSGRLLQLGARINF
jgi:hypothetical protein